MTEPQEWYYNTVTGEVELGPQSPMQNRLGPYATREDAEKALEIAKKRNKKWEDFGGRPSGMEGARLVLCRMWAMHKWKCDQAHAFAAGRGTAI